ncbi:MAG: hypothetical protein Q8Q73_06140 [Stagnimonas sp.]|nr:hypothetical protein [Stagnimonas sp.]
MFLSHRTPLLLAALALAAGLGACGNSSETPAATPASPAAAARVDGSITPDISNDRCKLIPPEQVAEYQAAHDVFKGAEGLEPQFTKGQLFHDQEVIRFKWTHASSQPLGISVDLLQRCSQNTVHNSPLYEEPKGSGKLSTPLYTSNAGSDYPSGTPAVVRVTLTVVDTQTMRGTTTTVGEYTIRLEGPKD